MERTKVNTTCQYFSTEIAIAAELKVCLEPPAGQTFGVQAASKRLNTCVSRPTPIYPVLVFVFQRMRGHAF